MRMIPNQPTAAATPCADCGQPATKPATMGRHRMIVSLCATCAADVEQLRHAAQVLAAWERSTGLAPEQIAAVA